ncbi:MAG: hypothetical protein J7647_06075 [Cyanobacteria bacterium SBLK]|nr:hypothetical protein [Cyanobacteria bacterium SBLK]
MDKLAFTDRLPLLHLRDYRSKVRSRSHFLVSQIALFSDLRCLYRVTPIPSHIDEIRRELAKSITPHPKKTRDTKIVRS